MSHPPRVSERVETDVKLEPTDAQKSRTVELSQGDTSRSTGARASSIEEAAADTEVARTVAVLVSQHVERRHACEERLRPGRSRGPSPSW